MSINSQFFREDMNTQLSRNLKQQKGVLLSRQYNHNPIECALSPSKDRWSGENTYEIKECADSGKGH